MAAKRALPLPVSAPFHCSLMVPAGEKLNDVLADITINPMSLPVVTNVEALPNNDHQRIRQLLVAQVSAPVKWDASVEQMVADGVDRFIEIGPGKVLSGLVKRINKTAGAANVEDCASLEKLLNS